MILAKVIVKLIGTTMLNAHLSLTMAFLLTSLIFLNTVCMGLEKIPQEQANKTHLSKEEISDWEARLELARALSYLKRYNESIQEYQTLLQSNPSSTIARSEMAKILFYQEKEEEGLAEISKIPSEEIDDDLWILIADIQRKKKNYQKAEDIYSQILKKSPQDDKTRLKLAEMLSWDKRYQDSIDQYRMLLKHHPDDIQLRRRYAQVLTWMGKDEEAAHEWEKTLK